MKNYKRINTVFLRKMIVPVAIIVSGLCWYFSNGLNGNFWYLLWFAPIPVLLVSFNATAKTTFFVSFLSYLIGRLSWFTYLVTVATLLPAIIFTIILPLIFAFIMIITRRAVIKTNSWYAIFAFPVFFTVFEFLLVKLSPDGTAASIAYSQSDFLPLIQIASVAGILGITFMVTFIPSALAIGSHYRTEKNQLQPLIVVSFVLVATVLIFGTNRISDNSQTHTTTVGLAVLEEKTHNMGNTIDIEKELQHIKNYAQEITKLAALGAKVAVLPERAININRETDSAAINILSSSASQNHIAIITGYTNFKNDKARNSALVIDAWGNVVMDYNKAFLVKGLESQFLAGSKVGLFALNNMQVGIGICKDLDFPDYIKKYGASGATLMYIPAWDFAVDDWLHSRMSILRGVENGFSEVRTARQGRLTISDCYGRVTCESNCSNGKVKALIGEVSTDQTNTLYKRYGDWFGIMNIVAAIFFLFKTTIRRWNGKHNLC